MVSKVLERHDDEIDIILLLDWHAQWSLYLWRGSDLVLELSHTRRFVPFRRHHAVLRALRSAHSAIGAAAPARIWVVAILAVIATVRYGRPYQFRRGSRISAFARILCCCV